MKVTTIKTVTALMLTPLTLTALFSSSFCSAHSRYILPSHTLLSSNKSESVSMTASISNDLFHPDMPLGDNGKGVVPEGFQPLFNSLQSILVLPNGKQVAGPSWQSFSRFSVADQLVGQDGTYRIILKQPKTLMTTYRDQEGIPGRQFGPNPTLPKNATHINRLAIHSSVETYISKNEPTGAPFTPLGKGLELNGDSHPNDLFVGEPVTFSLTYNGKPLTESIEIQLIPEDTRHRNQREIIQVHTDVKGYFKVSFKEAGFYLLEAELAIPADDQSDIDQSIYTLYVTLEVFPE